VSASRPPKIRIEVAFIRKRLTPRTEPLIGPAEPVKELRQTISDQVVSPVTREIGKGEKISCMVPCGAVGTGEDVIFRGRP
jgi:hypothetical protein